MILVVGPGDQHRHPSRFPVVNTTSRSADSWTTELSPFHLGPVGLYGGRTARIMENAWQFAKVYPDHVGADGAPAPGYWRWAQEGWDSARPVRYPRGKGAKPAYLWWDGEKLSYLSARLRVYFPLYRDAVAKTDAFRRIRSLYEQQGEITLFDFDGYEHESAGMNLAEVMLNPNRPMGHAFVLKAMLIYGPDVSPDDVIAAPSPIGLRRTQKSLFC